MSDFINYVFRFFYNIYDTIYWWFDDNFSVMNDVWDSKIFNGTLINISLTWQQLIGFLLPTITLFFFIILIFKIFWKFVGLFTK